MKLEDRILRIPRKLIKDERGWFLKAITGTEIGLPCHTGEVYFTSATPGQAKGGHYHILAQEWFTMIDGKGTLLLEDIYTKEHMSIKMDAEQPETIYIPQLVAHIVINDSQANNILCAYTDVLYDPKDTLTYEFK